jgi:hypothetical protein
MTEPEARELASAYANQRGWTIAEPLGESIHDGFLFRTTGDYPRVFVRSDGHTYALQGGLGTLWYGQKSSPISFGPPTSEENILASSWPGRYQHFERGVGVWEGQIGLLYGEMGPPDPRVGESVRPLVQLHGFPFVAGVEYRL